MRRAPLALLLAGLLALALAPLARADFGIDQFAVSFTDSEGLAVSGAGAHPFQMETEFRVILDEEGEIEEAVKNVLITQPAGLAGNPTAVGRCATADFLTGVETSSGAEIPNCPDSTAVGVAEVALALSGGSGSFFGAVYNLAPPPGVAAKLGFWIAEVPITVELGVSETPPFRIVASAANLSQVLEVIGATITLWGDPADPAHDPLRGACLDQVSGESLGECEAGVAGHPFLIMPRSCGNPLLSGWAVDSWENPGVFVSGEGESGVLSGCGKLAFEPRATATPTTTAAESASGLEVAIDISDENVDNPKGIVGADIDSLQIQLAQGITLNPSAAEGLDACTLAQFEAATLNSGGCPDAAKLGTIEADTPILEGHTLHGSFYLAAQADNPFDSLLAAYLFIRDEELGIFMKLPTRIDTNPASGQIETLTEDLPPYPLSRVRVRLRSGPRAPLVTPQACGAYASKVILTPSSGAAPLEVDSAFAITSGPGGGPCPPLPGPFSPGFEAGTENPAAGAYSASGVRLTRADTEQDLTRLAIKLPPGLTGKLAGVGSCTEAEIAAAAANGGRTELLAPSCPAASRLGSITAGAGVGTALTYVPGSLYLAGPYNGAPLSVLSVVPAVAGPIDLGTVITRFALNLDPDDARVEVDGERSDPIPHILEGIPLKLRDLRVAIDRPQFTLNATSCTPSAATGTAWGSGADPFDSADDTTTPLSSRYQAASCASLGFKPALKLTLTGATKRAQNPGFRAELKTREPDANLRGAIVNLPPSLFIDNAHIANPCTRAQFSANACPPRSVLGWGRAFTPLLDDPLEGPIYFRSNGGERKLPDLVIALGGQFQFNLVIAVLQASKGRVRTKVLNAPDAAVSKFVLSMKGGKTGLLENSENLCRRTQRGYLNLIGQNGRRHKTRPKVRVKACKRGKAKRSAGTHRRG